MDDIDQDALLRAARAADEAAFVILFRMHRDPVYRFAYRLLGSAEAAEDVTQECFLGLLGGLRRYDSRRASLRTYLLASVRNLALKHLRKRRPEVAIEDCDPARQPATETEIAVRRAIEALPLGQREPLILFEYEGLTLDQIAKVLAIDTGAVKSRLHRARENLREALAPVAKGVMGRGSA